MCTKPFPMMKWRFPWEEKWHTKVYPGSFLDEEDIWLSVMVHNLEKQGATAAYCQIPCGQCADCRLQYSRVWANRCIMEASLYPDDRNWFVTLTYAPDRSDHLLTPCSGGRLSLNKEDSQGFMKRLRRHYEYHHGEKNIRFFMCGEYGDLNSRPHYHFLLFNCPILDAEKIAVNKFGDSLYTSKSLEKIWGFGLVCLAPLNWNTAAYTARYVMKKQTGKKALQTYTRYGLQDPFTLSSRNPGIAGDYFDQNFREIYSYLGEDDEGNPLFKDKIILPSVNGKLNVVKPPRYFDKLLEKVNPGGIDAVKEVRRKFAELMNDERRKASDYSDREFYSIKEYVNQKKGKGLIRKMQELS